MLKKLDLLAIELFAEFGFATCSEDQQEKILQEFVERVSRWSGTNDLYVIACFVPRAKYMTSGPKLYRSGQDSSRKGSDWSNPIHAPFEAPYGNIFELFDNCWGLGHVYAHLQKRAWVGGPFIKALHGHILVFFDNCWGLEYVCAHL